MRLNGPTTFLCACRTRTHETTVVPMRNDNDVAIPFLLIAIVIALLFSGPSLAQVSTPAIGMTSPLSAVGSPLNPVGIPLGAVELDPGGLTTLGSPMTSGSIGTSNSGCTNVLAPGALASPSEVAGTTSALSTFDGGGVDGTTTMSGTSVNPMPSTALGTCSTTASSVSPSGTILSTTTGTSSGTSSTGLGTPAGIPLGSSELNNLGVSPLISIPTPDLADPVTSPMVAVPTLDALGTSCGNTDVTGMSSTSGC